jgi:hypothetical protein
VLEPEACRGRFRSSSLGSQPLTYVSPSGNFLEMGPSRYARFKWELRQTMRLVSDELGRRRDGVSGDGSLAELEEIFQELERLNRAVPSGAHRLRAFRIAGTWPKDSELRTRLLRLARLVGPELP